MRFSAFKSLRRQTGITQYHLGEQNRTVAKWLVTREYKADKFIICSDKWRYAGGSVFAFLLTEPSFSTEPRRCIQAVTVYAQAAKAIPAHHPARTSVG